MRHNWTDALEAAFRTLRTIADDDGFVTFAQINDAVPPHRFSSTEIEALLLAVRTKGSISMDNRKPIAMRCR